MGNNKSTHAQMLYRWLEKEWDARDTRPTAWCRQNGFSDATVLRWRNGTTEPDMRTLRKLADALDRSMIDVLVEAGYITKKEQGGYVVPEREYDLLETIRLDPKLSDAEREALRQLHDAFALVNSGRKRRVRVRGTVE